MKENFIQVGGMDKYKLSDIRNIRDCIPIIDKYNRIISGVNHGRTVLFDPKKRLFYKIFHPDYVRRKYFVQAIKQNFYDGMVPALIGLIYDGNMLVGYVTKQGKPLSTSEYDTHLMPVVLEEMLRKAVNKTGMFYYDLISPNVVELEDGSFSLIDLDSIYTLEQLPNIHKHNAKVKHDSWRQYIEKIYNEKISKTKTNKNVVFIPAIRLNDRSKAYDYSIKSWEKWCNAHNTELLIWDELIHDVDYMPIVFQRYYMFNILKSNNTEYDQVLIVDADTIVHSDCPDFFQLTEHKYAAVKVDGDYEHILRSILGFGDALFNGKRIPPWEFINGGFQIVNRTHENFFDTIIKYYTDNQPRIQSAIKAIRAGGDQTILNFMLKEHNIDVKILPQCFNLQDLARKNLLYLHPSNWWLDEMHNLEKSCWIAHFNAIPPNTLNRISSYWIERYYKYLYESGQ